MNLLKKALSRYRSLHGMARTAIGLGAATMLCFYITALFALIVAPYVDYANAMTIYRGCLEAAPASLAAGVCAGLIGDVIMSRYGGKSGSDDERK